MTRGDQRERDRAKAQAKLAAKVKGNGRVSLSRTSVKVIDVVEFHYKRETHVRILRVLSAIHTLVSPHLSFF